jgi:hypothetical protein
MAMDDNVFDKLRFVNETWTQILSQLREEARTHSVQDTELQNLRQRRDILTDGSRRSLFEFLSTHWQSLRLGQCLRCSY